MGVAGHEVESEREVFLGLEREAVAVALGRVVERDDVGVRCSGGDALHHGAVVPSIAIDLTEGAASLFVGEVLVVDIVERLREDALSCPVDAQELEVETEVGTEVLSELKVLGEDVNFLTAVGGLQTLSVDVLLVGVEDELQAVESSSCSSISTFALPSAGMLEGNLKSHIA